MVKTVISWKKSYFLEYYEFSYSLQQEKVLKQEDTIFIYKLHIGKETVQEPNNYIYEDKWELA